MHMKIQHEHVGGQLEFTVC